MPSGIVHAKCSALLSGPCLVLGYMTTHDAALALSCAVGCLMGVVLTPDLDQETLSLSESKIIKWTFGLGFLWVMFWYPYARACRHRSMLSHFPVMGTLVRLAYLSLLVLVVAHLISLPPVSVGCLVAGILGLVVSDAAHWVLDTMWRGHHT